MTWERFAADRAKMDAEVERLRAEMERLRVENAAMRPIVEEAAKAFIDYNNGRQDAHVYRLFSVALIEQARAFVAARPAEESS